jgi:tetratricopeptide (TPR) repeat protein
MPFVKKTQSQAKRPSSADRSPFFVGRTGELLFFVHNILRPEAPTHNILSIWGQGGVGKSTLLVRFIEEVCKAPFKDYCLTALVDERQTTPVNIMEKFADQLHITGEFEKAVDRYKESLRKLQSEREAAREDTWRKATTEIAGSAVKSVPVLGGMLEQGAELAAGYLWDEIHYRRLLKDAEQLENPISDLTRAFVREINHLADSQVTLSTDGSKRQRRIVLFFDTFEELAAEATPWFLDYFLEAQISSNVVLVVAGRDPIEHTSPDDPKRWLPYCDDGTIYWISLNSFTEDETRLYLVKRGITDVDRIATIWQLSRGLPLYLGLLTSNPRGDIDPTKDVVVNFLRWIPGQEHIKRQLALDAALLSKPFNQDDLEVFSYVPESDRFPLYQWLTGQPFVRSTSEAGRYLYHDVARDLFSRHLYQRSPKYYYEIRRALALYYQERFENIQVERGEEAYSSEEWLELLLAAVSQLMWLPDQASHIKAIEHILYADNHTTQKQRGATVRTLRDLSQVSSPHGVSLVAQAVTRQLLHYIEADRDSQEWLRAADALLEKVIPIPSFPSELLAHIYLGRAYAYNRTRSEFHNSKLAIENFQQSLKLLEKTNYAARGWASFYIGNYGEAFLIHNEALEQNPQAVNAYFGRGWAYLRLEEYQQAIDDFERVLELAPNFQNLAGLYNGFRQAYYGVGKYQEALSANDSLRSSYDEAEEEYYEFRSRCFRSLKDYQQSIDACNHALELAPKYALAYFQRGMSYLWLRDLQQAQADFARSYELRPTDRYAASMAEWVGLCQDQGDPSVSKRLEAIATIEPQSYSAHICQAIALLQRRHAKAALTELEQAIRLLPSNKWNEKLKQAVPLSWGGWRKPWDAYFWKGMACLFLEREEEAMEAIEKALEEGMPPVLLTPLRWFEQEKHELYEKYVVPLLEKHK